ncbi:hypothetical protein PsYK624_130420 [Phanerochaete sordida]|uniref:G domain-containing protein n=1 Tax=Phanerochaete sordida TaxID=48140 RepID=A0A9P3LIY4_9APHY|nr:hypothetical protein PsYK624_130420 [Phanerochaete sordida]
MTPISSMQRQPTFASETDSFVSDSDSSDYGELRSWFDDVTAECDVIRILLVGKSGSGKTTLVSKVFGFDLRNARVQAFSRGDHNIYQEITSPDASTTPNLRLHDSKGLESGSVENLKTIETFIKSREGRPLPEQLHAIWYCIEIPTAGQRPFEAGDIALLNHLKQSGNKVPVIIVFTKYDRILSRARNALHREHRQHGKDETTATALANQGASEVARRDYQKSCVDVLESKLTSASWMHHCAVSRKDDRAINALIELTESTLKESEVLKVIWASVQVADVELKIQASILVGKYMYWRVLGATMIPLNGIRRVTVLHVLTRIHRDIVRVWNLPDPNRILLGANMRVMVRKFFAEPMISPHLHLDAKPGGLAQGIKIVDIIMSGIANPAGVAAPLAVEAVKFLDSFVVSTPATVRVFMAYITNLILGLETLYWLARARRVHQLTRDDVSDAFTTYLGTMQCKEVQRAITDYIGDENVGQAWKRDKAVEEITRIVGQWRYDPATIFRSPLTSPALP